MRLLLMTDSTGLKVWGRSQEPFGENNASYNPVGVFTTTRFDGQFLDSLTGLHYNLMRDYDPTTGRYITADPIGLNGGRNRYGYALGNPATYTDPRGEYAFALIPVVSFVGLLLINEVFGDAWRKAGVGDAIEKTLYALGDDLSSLGANVRDMIGDSMITTEMGQSIYDYIFNQEENAGGQSTAGENAVSSDGICRGKDGKEVPGSRGKKWHHTTNPGSVDNIDLDSTRDEYENDLRDDGWVEGGTRDPEIKTFEKDGEKITTRPNSNSRGNEPAADYKYPSPDTGRERTIKIRLKP